MTAYNINLYKKSVQANYKLVTETKKKKIEIRQRGRPERTNIHKKDMKSKKNSRYFPKFVVFW